MRAVSVSASELRIDNLAGIASLATRDATGLVGNVKVTAGTAVLLNGGTISIEARQTLPENQLTEQTDTRILIRADHLLLDNGANITAESIGNVPASAIEIHAENLVIEGNSRISTQSSAGARGGDIQVTTQSMVRLRNSLITSEVGPADGSGAGGDIDIDAHTIELTDSARITAESSSKGNAGNMRLNARQTLLIDQSEVSTRAVLSDGGDVNITAGFTKLRNGQLTTAVGSGDGSGGNIIIDINLGLLDRSEIRANAFGGPGGNITIRADGFVTDVGSAVTASSQLSVDGTVTIQGLADLSGSLAPLDPNFAVSAPLIARCSDRFQDGQTSRLAIAGRTGLPAKPGSLLPIPLAEIAASAPSRQAAPRRPELRAVALAQTAWRQDCAR